MTGQAASASEPSAGMRKPRPRGRPRKIAPETEPQTNGPTGASHQASAPSHAQSNGQISAEPTAAQRISRSTYPLVLEPPIPPPNELQLSVINEARDNARRVSEGTCWQLEEDLPQFEESAFTFGDCELPSDSVWTSDQKYRFIELLGRRSAASLASIAQTLGKPLIECELYLEALVAGAEELGSHASDIPEAEEARDQDIEQTLFENEDHILGAADEDPEDVIDFGVLEERMIHAFAADGANALVRAFNKKVRALIVEANRISMYEERRLEDLEEIVKHDPTIARGTEDEALIPLNESGPLLYNPALVQDPVTDSETENI